MKKILIMTYGSIYNEQFVGYDIWGKSRVEALQEIAQKHNIELTFVKKSQDVTIPHDAHYDMGIFITSPREFIPDTTSVSIIKQHCDIVIQELLWETNKVPDLWINHLRSCDGIIAGSEFCISLASNAAPSVPKFYIRYSRKDIPDIIPINIRMKQETFNILYLGQNSIRKGIYDTVIAYLREFTKNDNVALYIKTDHGGDIHGAEGIHKTVRDVMFTDTCNKKEELPPIYTCSGFIPKENIESMYKNSSLLCLPSRGEGFGLPYLEAAWYGVPSLYVPFSATPEIAEHKANFPVEYVLDEAVGMYMHSYMPHHLYGVPLMRSIMEQLRNAYTLWKEQRYLYFTRCDDLRKKLVNRYSFDNSVRDMKAFLKHYNIL